MRETCVGGSIAIMQLKPLSRIDQSKKMNFNMTTCGEQRQTFLDVLQVLGRRHRVWPVLIIIINDNL